MDMLESASEEEMDMLMMMQMDKLSELCGDTTDTFLPSLGLESGATISNNSTNSSNSANSLFALQHNQSHYHDSSQYNYFNPSSSSSNNTQFPQNFLPPYSTTDNGSCRGGVTGEGYNNLPSGQKRNSMAAMREMIFRIAAMQPIHIDPESVKAPKRKNVKISKDPQSVAARHRRERISERIRILQRLVPGGTKMDTASMLDEAIHYVKFLKTQVQSLERANNGRSGPQVGLGLGFPVSMSNEGSNYPKAYHQGH